MSDANDMAAGFGKKVLTGMEKIDCISETESVVGASMKIRLVAKQIESTQKSWVNSSGIVPQILMDNIDKVLSYWSGNTFVGKRKESVLADAFQDFFKSLYQLFLVWRKSPQKDIRSFARSALYEGILYRYIGSCDKNHGNQHIEPEYDHLWVSWSKNAKNWYIEEHLYGAMTHLTCHIENPQYGIDLSAFGQSRGEENEVVYPMVEANIDRVEYIERD